MLDAMPVAMLRALRASNADAYARTYERTDGLTLEALPLAMEMAHSVTRATNRINDDGSTEARP